MGRGHFLMCAPEMELPGPRLFRAGKEASRPVSMVSASPEPARLPHARGVVARLLVQVRHLVHCSRERGARRVFRVVRFNT